MTAADRGVASKRRSQRHGRRGAPPAEPSRDRRGGALDWAILIVVVLSVGAYLPSLNNDFVYDDAALVLKDPRVTEPGHLGQIWSSDYWPGQRPSYNYRPLTTTSFALVHRALGAPYQRFVNLALHVTCSLLALWLALTLGLRRRGALVAALFFALHPLHSEALYLVVGRAELLAAALGMAMLLGVGRRWWLGWIGLLYAAALLCKESAVVLPLLAWLLMRVRDPGQPLRELVWAALKLGLSCAPGLALLLLLRWQVFGVFLAPAGHVDALYNPLVALSGGPRLVNALWVLVLYVKAALWPQSLSADYSCCQVALLDSVWSWRSLLILLLLAVPALLLAVRRWRWSLESFGVLFMLMALLPVSNLLFAAGVMLAERLMYLPLLGFCLLAGALFGRLWAWWQRAARRPVWLPAVLPVVALGLYGARVVAHDGSWQDDAAFTATLVDRAPRSAHAHRCRATHLKREGQLTAAEQHLRRAVAIYPRHHDAWRELGQLLAGRGRDDEAIEAFREAARQAARSTTDAAEAGPLWARVARLQLLRGECHSARTSLKRAARWARGDPPELRALRRRLTTCAPRP